MNLQLEGLPKTGGNYIGKKFLLLKIWAVCVDNFSVRSTWKNAVTTENRTRDILALQNITSHLRLQKEQDAGVSFLKKPFYATMFCSFHVTSLPCLRKLPQTSRRLAWRQAE